MNNNGINQYVVTFHYNEEGLTDVLELSSALINSGFSTTMKDDEGHPHELGTNTFGIISALSQEEIRQQAAGIGKLVLGKAPEVEVQHWKEQDHNTD